MDSNGYTLANSGALPAKHVSQWGAETALGFENVDAFTARPAITALKSPARRRWLRYTQFTASARFRADHRASPPTMISSAWYVQGELDFDRRKPSLQCGHRRISSPVSPKPAHPLAIRDGSGFGSLQELARRATAIRISMTNVLDPAQYRHRLVGNFPYTFTYYNYGSGRRSADRHAWDLTGTSQQRHQVRARTMN